MLENRAPFTLNFSRTGYFVFGIGKALNGGLEELLSLSFDSLKIRTSAIVIVTECEAYDFIGGIASNNDANVNKLLSSLIQDRQKTGSVFFMSVGRLFESVDTGLFDYCAALADVDSSVVTDAAQKTKEAEGEDPLEDAEGGENAGGLKSFVCGTALFSGLKMTGSLTPEQTAYLNMVCGEYSNGTVTLPCISGNTCEGNVTLMLKAKGVNRRMTIEGGKVHAEVVIRLETGVHEAPRELSEEELSKGVGLDG